MIWSAAAMPPLSFHARQSGGMAAALQIVRLPVAQGLLVPYFMTSMELRVHRLELGYSIHVLAEILAVSSARLSAWEKGDEPIIDADELDAAFRALRHAHRNVWPPVDATASEKSEAR